MTQNTAAAYLQALAGHGIESLFINAGTDFAPIVEAYAHNKEAGGPTLPAPIVCAHENLAVGMAHGAYLVSGRPQALMLHVSVGTANAVCGVINAARERIPMLVTAGRSPVLEEGAVGARDLSIHWAQELYDQAGMVRELVKWDYELRDPRQVGAVVDRALSVAMAQPRGPVYLSLPREVLATAAADPASPPSAATPVPAAVHPDPEAVRLLADRLISAELPVIVATAAGADQASVALLDQCCERFGIGVAEQAPRYLNVRWDHPHHLGGQVDGVLDRADVVLFLECDVPWSQSRTTPRPETFLAHAGVDPIYTGYPMRTHRADLNISASPSTLLRALIDALGARAGDIDPGRVERVRQLAATVAESRDRLSRSGSAEAAPAGDGPITKLAISAELGQLLGDDDIVFNEYAGVPDVLRRSQPGTYFYLPAAGGLGWGLPAALGAKYAAVDRTVVALLGDGAYVFANPAACHHAAAKYGLPVLTVVANNSTWGAVDLATRLVYPDGRAVAVAEDRFSDLSPTPDFAAYCRASGGHGETVTSRDRLAGALEEALHVVRHQGRQALLDIRCS